MQEPEKGRLEGAKNGIQEVCKDNKGCPNGVFVMAKTKWQREVGVEFMKIHEKIQDLRTELRWIKFILGAITITMFIATIFGR